MVFKNSVRDGLSENSAVFIFKRTIVEITCDSTFVQMEYLGTEQSTE